MSKKISISVVILIVVAAMLLSFLCGYAITTADYLDRLYKFMSSQEEETVPNEKLNLIIDIIKAYSYYEVDEEALCRALIEGTPFAIGDYYAEYFNAEELAKFNASSAGENCGIGVQISENVQYGCIEIAVVFLNSPAEKAGVMAGDLITEILVDGEYVEVASIGYNAARAIFRGEKGTEAKLKVVRDGKFDEPIEFSIVRDNYISQSVLYHVCETDPTVGIVRLTSFDIITPKQFCEAMDALIDAGAKKFIFDVRNNGGGNRAAVTAVLSYLLKEGDTIVKTTTGKGVESTTLVGPIQYKDPQYVDCNITKEDIGKYHDAVNGKSAVLVNGLSASAAELFTVALMDYEVSTIVGTRTYGKGSIQTVIELKEFGFDGAVKLTTKKYFPPFSEGYDKIGITPKVVVELDESLKNKNIFNITDEEDNQLQTAISSIGK
jgi:carboxyl-terminal processing protease